VPVVELRILNKPALLGKRFFHPSPRENCDKAPAGAAYGILAG
jgi:hypothetical protein